ncbi:MAG: hypothetical protein ABMA64_32780 [Myxococcota bacterium]
MIVAVAALAAEPEADALLAASRAAEADGRWDDAVAACREVVQRWPHGPRADPCARRSAALERRRDPDGTFRSWAALEGVRRTRPGDARAQVEGLWADRAAAEVVRAEAAVWLAREELERDASLALVHAEPWLRDPVPDEPALTRELRQLAAEALARVGRFDDAHAVEDEVKVPAAPEAARLTAVDRVAQERSRRSGAWAAGGAVVVFAGVAGPAVKPRRFVPVGLVPLGIAVAGAAALIAPWEPRLVPVVVGIGAANAAVYAVSALALSAAERPGWRAAIRLAAVGATFGVGYLGLWATGNLGAAGL